MINLNTYIISDTHFGHENILKHEPIRQKLLNESSYNNFDKFMVEKWNEVVGKNDLVFHLGDVSFDTKNLEKIIKQLNGKKIVLVGNHDKSKHIEILKQNNWQIIDKIAIDIEDTKKVTDLLKEINNNFDIKNIKSSLLCCYVKEIEGTRVMFSHFPVFDENPHDQKFKDIVEILEYIYIALDCQINIHGHIHSRTVDEKSLFNVSVENILFKPILLKDIISSNLK